MNQPVSPNEANPIEEILKRVEAVPCVPIVGNAIVELARIATDTAIALGQALNRVEELTAETLELAAQVEAVDKDEDDL